MQLLSPTQVKAEKSRLVDEQVRIATVMSARATEETLRLNQITEQRKEEERTFALRKQELDKTREALEGEIASLEKRREEAMKPVDSLIEQWKTTNKHADIELEEVKKLREEHQKKIEEVHERLEEIEELRLDAQEKIDELNRRELGIATSEKHNADSTRELTERIAKHAQQIAKKEQSITSKEQTLQARQNALDILERTFREQKGEWLVWKAGEERRLADQRATLERALSRIKK